jgi:hypothetical protein
MAKPIIAEVLCKGLVQARDMCDLWERKGHKTEVRVNKGETFGRFMFKVCIFAK